MKFIIDGSEYRNDEKDCSDDLKQLIEKMILEGDEDLAGEYLINLGFRKEWTQLKFEL